MEQLGRRWHPLPANPYEGGSCIVGAFILSPLRARVALPRPQPAQYESSLYVPSQWRSCSISEGTETQNAPASASADADGRARRRRQAGRVAGCPGCTQGVTQVRDEPEAPPAPTACPFCRSPRITTTAGKA